MNLQETILQLNELKETQICLASSFRGHDQPSCTGRHPWSRHLQDGGCRRCRQTIEKTAMYLKNQQA